MLYGTTQYGGPQTPFCAASYGTLFQKSTRRSEEDSARIFLAESEDGAYPTARVSRIRWKTLRHDDGRRPRRRGRGVRPQGRLPARKRVLHSFSCCGTSTDGSFPFGGSSGSATCSSGATRNGGTSNAGTTFSMRPAELEAIVHDFPREARRRACPKRPHRRRKSAFRYDRVRVERVAGHGLPSRRSRSGVARCCVGLRSGRAAAW